MRCCFLARDRPRLEQHRPATRVLYSGLLALAAYTGWRGWRASRDLFGRAGDWRAQYVENLGFTVIALFDGFVIVTAMDLGAPGWLVVAIGAVGILAGRLAIKRTQKRVATFRPTVVPQPTAALRRASLSASLKAPPKASSTLYRACLAGSRIA